MTIKKLAVIPAILVVSACGGGGGGDSASAPTTPTPATGGGGGGGTSSPEASALKVFSDGTGVGSIEAENGSKGVVITPDIAGFVAAANNDTEQDIADSSLSDFPVVQKLGTNANLREGTITVDGVTANVTAIEDLGGEAGLFLFEVPNVFSVGLATGSALTGNPVGPQTYSGTMTMGPRAVNSNQESGSFTMGADFNAETYTFNGTTSNNKLNGSGVIATQSGTFSSNNLSATTNGTNRTATMYGQLHGNDAKSVSGVFHTNENSPDYTGGFVGSRP